MRRPLLAYLIGISLVSEILSGCAASVDSRDVSNAVTANASSSNVPVNASNSSDTIHAGIPKNVILTPEPEAAKIPRLFYDYLNKGQYDKAVSLYGPDLKQFDNPQMLKYLKNIEHAGDFTTFEDISNAPGALTTDYSRFYAVKFYYAEFEIKVRDQELNPYVTNGMQYRRFTVVKMTKDGPWLLDLDEDYSQP